MIQRVRTAAHRQATMLGAILLIGMLALSAGPAVGQVTTKLVTTGRMDPGPTIGAGFAVSHDSGRTVELVLLAHRIEDDQIVDTHRSSPFRVAADRPHRLDERHLPEQRFYRGGVTGQVVTTRSAVSLESAERGLTREGFWAELQERTDITDWSNVRSFREWRPRDGVVFIALPADARLRRDARVYPMLVFTERAPR